MHFSSIIELYKAANNSRALTPPKNVGRCLWAELSLQPWNQRPLQEPYKNTIKQQLCGELSAILTEDECSDLHIAPSFVENLHSQLRSMWILIYLLAYEWTLLKSFKIYIWMCSFPAPAITISVHMGLRFRIAPQSNQLKSSRAENTH